ncbi:MULTISPECIES: tyrosine-type recombinase/integrase [unclassified Peribacillus]|uniref:tyrosine-type recombinase/integrase n=1 Tax=unclassified Peribacillus TaxID=2675266 RepID=UPI00366BA46C
MKTTLVFERGNGLPYSKSTLHRAFNRICRKAGITKHITIHGLRHTHAVLQLEAGADMKYVQKRLGHGSVAITSDVYAHISKKLEKKNMDKFEEYTKGLDVGKEMLSFLGLLCIVVTIFIIIAAVISAFRKTRKVKKRLLTALGSFILFFIFYAVWMSLEGEKPSEVTQEKTAKITKDEYKKIKDGMTLEEVKTIVGGKEKSQNKFDDFVEYNFDGENGVESDAYVILDFNYDKTLDKKIEIGLLSPRDDTEVSTEEDTEEDPTESLKDHIEYQLTEDNDFNIVNLEAMSIWGPILKTITLLSLHFWEVKT